jgi:hypothetical protein
LLRFVRTVDYSFIKGVLTHPTIYPHIGDDFAPTPKLFEPNQDERIWYLAILDDNRTIGLAMFVPRSRVLYEVHLSLYRNRRRRGVSILTAALRWMFDSSEAQRIIAEVPACNRLAVRLAGQVMTHFGSNSRSFLKHGALENLILFGISKP